MKKSELLSLILSLSGKEMFFIEEMVYDNKSKELRIRMNRNGHLAIFGSLSSGEILRVLLEISIQLSIFFSKLRPTLLIIEQGAFGSLDSGGVNRLFEIVTSNNFYFQFIFVGTLDMDNYNFGNINMWRFAKTKEEFKIENIS